MLFFAAFGVRAAENPNDEQLRAAALPAVVTLYSVGAGSEHSTSRGVGFLVSSEGILVTARHVSEANAELFAFTSDGRKYPVTGFYGEDRDYDVAVLKIEGKGFAPLAVAPGLPKRGEWVAVLSPEPEHGGTRVLFRHDGLAEEIPDWDLASVAHTWATILDRLKVLAETGHAEPALR